MVTPAEGAAGRQLRRDVSPLGLMFVSLGSIIGSGWLFGALYASQIAGPAAIIAWVAGGLVMLLLALVHAELRSMYPVAGGSARYPLFSFGSTVGFRLAPVPAGLRWTPEASHFACPNFLKCSVGARNGARRAKVLLGERSTPPCTELALHSTGWPSVPRHTALRGVPSARSWGW